MRKYGLYLLLMLMLSGLGVFTTGCTDKKPSGADSTAVADTTPTDTLSPEDSIIAEQPMPKAADELFDDFFFNFAANRKLQRDRIDFPLKVFQDGKLARSIQKNQWHMDHFFMRQDYYTLIFDSQKQTDLVKDTSVSHVVVEKISLRRKMVKRYVFDRVNGQFRMTSINIHAMSKNNNASFLQFYERFATDTAFQIRSMAKEVTFTSPNPDNDFAIDMPVNSIRVVCLPFDLPEGSLSVMSLNKYVDAKTYGIHSLSANEESGVSLLGLELQTDAGYKAGTPFFLEVGDCTLYTDDPEAQEMATIVFVPTLTTDATAQTVNGLVGTLDGDTIKASGYGYIEKSALACSKQVGEEEAGLAIPGQQGYIDPKLVTNKEGNADLTLMVTEMLDGVNKVTVKKQAENAGIYSIDGKYLGTSAKNLQKGIYIVGKKKVAVK